MKDTQIYCVKCKKAVVPVNVELENDRRGRPRLHGECSVCGTHVYRYVAYSQSST